MDENTPSEGTTRRPRSRRPPKWIWGVVAVCGLLIVGARGTDVLRDHAVANVATWILSFLAAITVLIWWWGFSGFSRRVRLRSFLSVLAVIGTLVALFRVERISGELIPTFAFRFSAKHDQRMPQQTDSAPVAAVDVDLLTTTPHDFPEFLGRGRRASAEGVRLGRDWSVPPRPLWRHEIGAGWSAFSVVNGHAITMEQRGDQEMVSCYNVLTGDLEWSSSVASRHESISGGVGPRSTPAIDEGLVYALGASGHLMCLDGATGRLKWQKNLTEEYGGGAEEEKSTVSWGRANSPLVVDDLLVVPAGGLKQGRKVSLLAVRKRTGEVVWQGGERQISYSSPAVASVGGVRQLLIVNEDTASGHDVATGRVLWEHPWPGRSYADPNVSQAVAVAPDRVLLSKGYGQGAVLLQLKSQPDGTFATEVAWRNANLLRTKFTNVAVKDGYAYGLSDGILECVELTSGRRAWKDGRYRHGQILRAGDLLLVLSESGEVVLIEADPARANQVLGRFQALQGLTWNSPALFGPYLLIRNAEQAACYQLPVEGRQAHE